MNKQIKELAKQAGINSPDGFKLTVNHMATFQLEKFAELIVRECGRVYIQNQQDGVMTLTQDLLQHFRVQQ